MLAHPRASQARSRASQVHPRVKMILVLLKPTWILRTRPRVGRDGENIRYNYILLYVMIIVDRCIVSLIFNKCYLF